MGFFTGDSSSISSDSSSDASASTSEAVSPENGNLMYLIKNWLVLSKEDVKKTDAEEAVKFRRLDNRLNNCYCNVVIQSLFASHEFRRRMVKLRNAGVILRSQPFSGRNVIGARQTLQQMPHARRYGVYPKNLDVQSARNFLKRVVSSNDDFVLGDQQDAHEFLTYVLNEMIDEIRGLEGEAAKAKPNPGNKHTEKNKSTKKTWLNHLVEGCLKSETKCHECKSVTAINEPFLTLSLSIFDNCNINLCLERYCDYELLTGKDQFFCETCNKYCDASKRVVFDLMPPLLILHLKRFKFSPKPSRGSYRHYERLPYPVVSNNVIQVSCKQHPTPIDYELFSVISHIGTSPDYGHYINISELHGEWFRCDDASIVKLNSHHADIGDETTSGNDASYILFYRIKP